MGIEVFNRYEKKFLIDLKTYEVLRRRLDEHLELDAFNKEKGSYTVCNIYYDTQKDELIKKSISKPIYKEKLRLRAYGIPDPHTRGYLEIKKKYKGLVNKRRTSIAIEDAVNFVKTGIKPDLKSYHNQQVINEIDFFIKRYDIEPAIYIAYDREAYFSIESKDLRITFDKNIRTRRYDLALDAGDYGEPLISPNLRLMEIKAEKAFPIWLTHLLAEMKLYPRSFSKYGVEYVQYSKNKSITKGDVKLCSNSYIIQPQPVYQL